MRRIGVSMFYAADAPEGQSNLAAFAQGSSVATCASTRAGAQAIWIAFVDTLPNWLRSGRISSSPPRARLSLQQASRTVPIVFVTTIDPVGGGWVESLARPGTNATGFTSYDIAMGGKWLDLLREVAPAVTRVAVIRDASVPAGTNGFAAIQTVAGSFGVELTPIGVRDAGEMERGIVAFAKGSSAGLIVVGPPSSLASYYDLIIALAARHKLPAVYSSRLFVDRGGLISCGANAIDQYRRAASYVDRILKGEKPADLPVQNPTKYEMVLNLKTAKELGLVIPQTLLANADELIE
jgi:putative tryptophan/tyrosine transport system substrate-binding protein